MHLLDPLARFRAFSHRVAAPDAPAPGPLQGVTLAVKGNIPVAGLPWTEGSAVFATRIATTDAACVARLKAAGAVVVGMTTLSEMAMYAPDNAAEPMGLNPFDVTRTAGGSSTGSGVAVALGQAVLGLGTDSGGSVRNPALHGGVVGFKPSLHAWDYGGVTQPAPSLDTLGLIARDVATLARGAAVLGTPPGRARPCLLVPTHLVKASADAATRALFAAALDRCREAGIETIEAEIPLWREADAACGVISLAEGGAWLDRLPADAPIGPRLVARRAAHRALDPAAVAEARAICAAFTQALRDALRDATAIATPGWPFAAPPIEAETVEMDGTPIPLDPARSIFVRTANAAGAPAITLPAGLYPRERVPFGLHLLAAPGADAALLALAAQVEAALPPAPMPPV
ncbi:amidase [Falsiroseomonas stagni]|uniref:Mandelamide amidase n=1 Tax=Falsiroseomonas stagni DSM 19981 TaxID=1123062 RepID=A0A1I3Y7X0_9PROT|nr:amidase [Falsiroseomonas stagni]SFK28067.1 mandelamide amidase [Falsiroseomonas stagni DSM 19981]